MRKRTIVLAVLVAAPLVAGAVALKWQPDLLPATQSLVSRATPEAPRGKAPSGNSGRSVTVEAATARAATTSDDLRSIGSLYSEESVQVASEIAGRVESILLTEGKEVAAGDILVKLDDILARAELAEAEARLKLAEANLERANSLSRSGNVTIKARDEAVSNSETAQAAIELARARLGKHTITAPFGGIVGIRKVSPGAFVAIGAPIVNLEQIDPIKLSFQLPEIYMEAVRPGQRVEITLDALPGRRFQGEIYAIDPQIDVNGRSLQIRARLPNREKLLRPGLFARVSVKAAQRREVVMIPESAVVPRGEQTLVYRIENGRVQEVIIKLGARRDGEVEVLEGLVPEQRIVTAGQLKLRDGAAVEVIALADRTPQD